MTTEAIVLGCLGWLLIIGLLLVGLCLPASSIRDTGDELAAGLASRDPLLTPSPGSTGTTSPGDRPPDVAVEQALRVED